MKRRLELANAVILFLMFLITFFQVVSRVVLSTSSVWSEELARLTYVVMVFLGAALLVRDDGLIRVTVLTDRVGKRTGQDLSHHHRSVLCSLRRDPDLGSVDQYPR